MLKKFEIGNFKAFGDIQTVEIKPLTLLFGPNSSGKSTILQALIYLSEALQRKNWDVNNTRQGGEFIEFGGIENIVYQKDLSKTIHFGLTLSGLRIISSFHLRNDDMAFSYLEIKNFIDNKVKKNSDKAITLKDLLNNQIPHYECTFTVRFGINPSYKRLDYLSIIEDDCILNMFRKSELIQTSICPEGEVISLKREDRFLFKVENIKIFSRFFLKSTIFRNREIERLINEDQISVEDKKVIENRILNFLEANSIDEDDDQFIAFFSSPDDDEEVPILLETLSYELNDLNAFIGFDKNVDSYIYPLENEMPFQDYISQVQHIGYFRPVPGNVVKLHSKQKEERCFRTVWESLIANDKVRNKINLYLSDPDYLDTGYRLITKKWNIHSEEDQISDSFETLEIEDLNRKTIVNLRALGQGIIQIIPILTKILDSSTRLVSIEQPELHLHPALQGRLGVIFSDLIQEKIGSNSLSLNYSFGKKLVKEKQIFIETHSEHIIKAIQVEVSKNKGLAHNDISIHYIKKDDHKPQSVIRKIKLDETGSFTEPWPDDFFELSADLSIERLKNIHKTRN